MPDVLAVVGERSEKIAFLRQMMLIRKLEEIALNQSRAEPPVVVGSIHLCAGQEAVPVGAMAALEPLDQVVSTYRGHGWAIASGLLPVEVLGEICHRTVGINGGRAGSAYMMAPRRRFIGENSIVGAGVPIACGVALANQSLATSNVVVVSIGDGALNQGASHEGLVFAAARALPMILICENNGWSEMTATDNVFKIQRLSDRAPAYGIPGITIDGTDPSVVRDTVWEFAQKARSGGGPALIECVVPRMWGHYNRDIEHYRSNADRRAAALRDPIVNVSKRLITDGLLTEEEFQRLDAEVAGELQLVLSEVLASPSAPPDTANSDVFAPRSPETHKRSYGLEDSEGQAQSQTMTYIRAVNEALRAELRSNPNVLVYGEDVGKSGGIFGAARQLQKEFGEKRVFDTPICESAILGSAVGAAISGMKPIVEIMWADFMLVALDQLINQAANIRYITRGEVGVPIVVRTQQGATPGSCAQHSQSLEALLLHIPGLRVAMPSTPQDAYSLLRSAVAASDPCIVIESRGLYQTSGPVELTDVIEPIGLSCLRRAGTDAVILTWGTMVQVSLTAAEAMAQDGLHVAVLDLRWLCPIDEDAIIAAVTAASGRVVVVHEANLTAGFGAEIAQRLRERIGRKLDLRISRVATPDTRMPAAPLLQKMLLPDANRVASAVKGLLAENA